MSLEADQAARYALRSHIDGALMLARNALENAQTYGRRKDCLREAVRSLEGALRNVEMEDVEWERERARAAPAQVGESEYTVRP